MKSHTKNILSVTGSMGRGIPNASHHVETDGGKQFHSGFGSKKSNSPMSQI